MAATLDLILRARDQTPALTSAGAGRHAGARRNGQDAGKTKAIQDAIGALQGTA